MRGGEVKGCTSTNRYERDTGERDNRVYMEGSRQHATLTRCGKMAEAWPGEGAEKRAREKGRRERERDRERERGREGAGQEGGGAGEEEGEGKAAEEGNQHCNKPCNSATVSEPGEAQCTAANNSSRQRTIFCAPQCNGLQPW